MRHGVGALLAIGLLVVLIVGAEGVTGSNVPGPLTPTRLVAAADPPVVVLSRDEMLEKLVASGAASKDTVPIDCPKDAQINFAPDGSLVRTSGLGIYHREHPEVWILADGSCAFDPLAIGTKSDAIILP